MRRSVPPRFSVLAVLAVPVVLVFFFTACAAYQNLAHPPKVTLADVQLKGASLAGADLVFRFQVENPNSRGMVLDGIGYKLRLNGQPMLEGRHDQPVEIAAGLSTVELPMTVGYADLLRILRTIRGLAASSKPTYDLDADFRFAVPILGSVSVPVSKHRVMPPNKVRLEL